MDIQKNLSVSLSGRDGRKYCCKEFGALDRKIAGTADSKHSMFKCLVNTCIGIISIAQMTQRFLTKVNTKLYPW